MEKLTVTEALAETKLIGNKIAKKRAVVLANATRFSHVADPFANDGGGASVLKREMQAIDDLNTRLVAIRLAIADANLGTKLKIGTVERTVTGWLAWRKEVATADASFWGGIAATLERATKQVETNPPAYKDETGKVKLSELIYNVQADSINANAQAVQEVLDVLDGKLSLLNATTVVEF